MSWIILLGAIISEVLGTTCMKLSQGFTRLIPAVCMLLLYGLSLILLSMTLKKIEVGIAYAVWSGVGTALIALIGIAFFREGISLMKIGGIVLVITGAIMLHMTAGAQ